MELLYTDQRIPIIRNLLASILKKSDIAYTNIMVTDFNDLILIVYDTVIYRCHLKECISAGKLFIDNRTFTDEYIMGETFIPITDFDLANNILRKYHDYCMVEYPLYTSEKNLKDSELFQPYLNLKTDNGNVFYKGDNINKQYIMPVFNGFPALNKSDNMNIDVYQMDNKHQMIKLSIDKKKLGRTLYMYYRVLDFSSR